MKEIKSRQVFPKVNVGNQSLVVMATLLYIVDSKYPLVKPEQLKYKI